MILYNITISIDKNVEEAWLSWMKTKHIPDMLATGMFKEHKMYKLLHSEGDTGITYAVQYFADSMDEIEVFQKRYAATLQEEHKAMFINKYVIYRSLLESV